MTDTPMTHDENIESENNRLSRHKGKAKTAFKFAATMGGIMGVSFVSKSILMGLGMASLPAYFVTATAIAGGMTLNKFRKDYNAVCEADPEADMSFGAYMKANRKECAKQFGIRLAMSFAGAGIVWGLAESGIFSGISETVSGWFNGAPEGAAVETADANPVSTDTPAAEGADTAPDAAEVNPDEVSTSGVDYADAREAMIEALKGVSEDLTPEGQELLRGLEAGEAWALESAGTSSLNGTHGIPCVTTEEALAMIEQAAKMGNENAMIDMAYFQYHGLHCYEMDKDAALDLVSQIGRGWAGLDMATVTPAESSVAEAFSDMNTAEASTESAAPSTATATETTVETTTTTTTTVTETTTSGSMTVEAEFQSHDISAAATGQSANVVVEQMNLTAAFNSEPVATCVMGTDSSMQCFGNESLQPGESVRVQSVYGDVQTVVLDSASSIQSTQSYFQNKVPMFQKIFYSGR